MPNASRERLRFLRFGLALLAAVAAAVVARAALQTPAAGAISAGVNATLYLRPDGTVWAWGDNSSGQLGDGSTVNRVYPQAIPGLAEIVAVAAGRAHSLAVRRDGTVWAWGSNASGELGDGTTVMRPRPIQVDRLKHIVAVAAGGDNFSVALGRDGRVWTWGSNFHGQLGDTTRTPRLRPVAVAKLDHVVAISAGKYHVLALKDDGTAWAWGGNGVGQIGDNTQVDRDRPVPVRDLRNIVAIAAGSLTHSVALDRDGTVWAWGNNLSGQFGDDRLPLRIAPVAVVGVSGVTAIYSGSSHVLARKADGAMWGWGANFSGQVRLPAQADHLKPAALPNWPADVAAVSTAGNRTVVLTTGGEVLSTGDNLHGEYGDGTSATMGQSFVASDPATDADLVEKPSFWPISAQTWHPARLGPPAEKLSR